MHTYSAVQSAEFSFVHEKKTGFLSPLSCLPYDSVLTLLSEILRNNTDDLIRVPLFG